MNKKVNNNTNLSESIKKLKSISEWFEAQSDLDIETGLEKIKEGAILVRKCKERLGELENSFKEVKKELEQDNQ